MRSAKSFVAFLICTTLFCTSMFSQEKSEPNGLDRTEPMMKGHVVALYFAHLLESLSSIVDYNAPVMVSYNEDSNKIELEILGSQTTIDKAKNSTDTFRRELLRITFDGINDHFGLTLSESDIVVSYYNKKSFTKILEYRDGKYSIDE